MTDVLRPDIDDDITQLDAAESETYDDEPICIGDEQPNEVERRQHLLWRATKKTLRYAGYVTLSASTIFAAQNPRDTFVMGPGLFASGEMKIPDVEGCDPYVPPPPVTVPTPPTTTEPGTPSTTVPPPETTIPTSDPEDEKANRATSAARNNSLAALSPLNLYSASREYGDYFDHHFATHTSELSGIEYRFYLVGGDTPPILSLESFDAIEYAAFHEDLTYFTPEKQHAIDCMRIALFGDDEGQAPKFEGRVMPIVIPADPACVRDFRIRYEAECAQSGYKMPRMDIDFLFWDLNPSYDEFMVITTGARGGKFRDASKPSSLAHELFHMQAEWTMGSAYRFQLEPEEKMAEAIDIKIDSNDVLDCALPPLFYGSEAEYQELVAENDECETDWSMPDAA